MFLKNHAKSKVFQNNWRPQAFFVKILCQVGDSIFIAAEVSTKPVHSPSGVQRNSRTRRGAPSLMGWMGWDGMGRNIKSAKVKCFETTNEHRPFLSKFDVKLGSWGIIHTSPSGVQRRIYTTSAKREFDGVGWVGSGRVGWMGRKIKSVLQISLYFVSI